MDDVAIAVVGSSPSGFQTVGLGEIGKVEGDVRNHTTARVGALEVQGARALALETLCLALASILLHAKLS